MPPGTSALTITGINPDKVKRAPKTTDLEITLVTKLPLIGSGEVC